MEKSESYLIEKICESSDMCINHLSLNKRELKELSQEENPSLECAICDGLDYNCPEYSSIEERNH